MSSYLLLIYGDPAEMASMTPEIWDQMLAAHREFAASVETGGGKILSGEALAPPHTATSVRGAGTGSPTVTDGPFVETKETLGGYYLIDASDLDAALGFAKILPAGPGGGVEVRPVVDTSSG
jgi:hypothetical protein